MPSEQGFLDLNEDVNQRMIGVSLQVLIQQVWVGPQTAFLTVPEGAPPLLVCHHTLHNKDLWEPTESAFLRICTCTFSQRP